MFCKQIKYPGDFGKQIIKLLFRLDIPQANNIGGWFSKCKSSGYFFGTSESDTDAYHQVSCIQTYPKIVSYQLPSKESSFVKVFNFI